MAIEDEFDRIVETVPDLAALDDGYTLVVTGPGVSISVARVDFERWVEELVEETRRNPSGWLRKCVSLSGNRQVLIYSLVREAYFCLAEFVFANASPGDARTLLETMQAMAMFCRRELVLMKGDVNE